MKPILFNTDMVRGLLNGTKTVTRRAVKPQPPATAHVAKIRYSWSWSWWEDSDSHEMKSPYHRGDILYVRETWTKLWYVDPDGYTHYDRPMYYYAADGTPDITLVDDDGFELDDQRIRWHPSIHMPREAARIFLRVTDVRVERLQDSFFKHGSTIFSLLREGIDIGEQCRECIDAYGSPCCIDSESECGVLDEVRSEFADLWNRCYAAPRPVKGEDGTIDHYESYPWEDIQETRTYEGKPWYVIGNPWVWVIEFEQCKKPEGADMDYKELIKQLRNAFPADGYELERSACESAADAIETLLAERDAAVEHLSHRGSRCGCCAYNYHSIHDYPCKHCKETGGISDYWEWSGPQKEPAP